MWILEIMKIRINSVVSVQLDKQTEAFILG